MPYSALTHSSRPISQPAMTSPYRVEGQNYRLNLKFYQFYMCGSINNDTDLIPL
jgi:hypothetical protein